MTFLKKVIREKTFFEKKCEFFSFFRQTTGFKEKIRAYFCSLHDSTQ